MTTNYPFEQVSNWLDTPDDIQPTLDSDLTVDVAIIGGGFTGLSTAIELKRRGLDVAIVELAFCGSGASGRNAGHLTPTIGKDIPSILRMFGKEKTRKLLHFADTAIEHTETVIKDNGIDCDYVANGNIIASVHPSQEAGLRKVAEVAAELGAHVQFLDSNHMRQRGLPKSFTAGVWETLGGVLQPGKYVLGLRKVAIQAGVKIFEYSPMKELIEGTKPVVKCEGGSITASHVVQATNAYTNSTGRMKRMVLPMRVTLFETAPLTDAQKARLGWEGHEGLYTAHEMLENFRMTKHGTLIGGSKIVRTEYGGGLAEGYHEPTFDGLTSVFKDRFPELSDVKIEKWWGGWIGMTTNFLPKIGTSKKHPNIHHAIGFNGHGIPQATMTGAILADRITGKDNEFGSLFEKPGFAWPPEPLTWLAGKALTGVMGAMDGRTDRKIRQSLRHG